MLLVMMPRALLANKLLRPYDDDGAMPLVLLLGIIIVNNRYNSSSSSGGGRRGTEDRRYRTAPPPRGRAILIRQQQSLCQRGAPPLYSRSSPSDNCLSTCARDTLSGQALQAGLE